MGWRDCLTWVGDRACDPNTYITAMALVGGGGGLYAWINEGFKQAAMVFAGTGLVVTLPMVYRSQEAYVKATNVRLLKDLEPSRDELGLALARCQNDTIRAAYTSSACDWVCSIGRPGMSWSYPRDLLCLQLLGGAAEENREAAARLLRIVGDIAVPASEAALALVHSKRVQEGLQTVAMVTALASPHASHIHAYGDLSAQSSSFVAMKNMYRVLAIFCTAYGLTDREEERNVIFACALGLATIIGEIHNRMEHTMGHTSHDRDNASPAFIETMAAAMEVVHPLAAGISTVATPVASEEILEIIGVVGVAITLVKTMVDIRMSKHLQTQMIEQMTAGMGLDDEQKDYIADHAGEIGRIIKTTRSRAGAAIANAVEAAPAAAKIDMSQVLQFAGRLEEGRAC